MIDILAVAKTILNAEFSVVTNNPVTGVAKDVYAGYESMSPEEKASFWKNVMITSTAVGAKVA